MTKSWWHNEYEIDDVAQTPTQYLKNKYLQFSDREIAQKLSQRQPVTISACCLRSGEVTGEDDGQRRVARNAFEMAGLAPEDIEVAEVHDAMAPGEMFRIEKLGLRPEAILGKEEEFLEKLVRAYGK